MRGIGASIALLGIKYAPLGHSGPPMVANLRTALAIADGPAKIKAILDKHRALDAAWTREEG